MSPEQINIAIAKACGWQHYHLDLWVPPQQKGDPDNFSELQCTGLPDYCADLNAIHEAEKILMTEPNLMNKYQNYELSKFVSSVNSNWLCRATSAQRAEAFLRTLNLWTP